MKRIVKLIIVVAFLMPGFASAELWDRGGGLIYDDVLDITWLQNANLAATENFGVSGIDSDGEMDWYTAIEWIAAMNASGYKGYSDWRLPLNMPLNGENYNYNLSYDGSTDKGFNISAEGTIYEGSTYSEMAHLYYNSLGNLGRYDFNGVERDSWGPENVVPFNNIQMDYWLGAEYAPDPERAWHFHFAVGNQSVDMKSGPFYGPNYVWVVRDGDVDSDQDGISDGEDTCPDTQEGEVVDYDGCSIYQLCPDSSDWKNHGAYMKCIVHMAEKFLSEGLITEEEKDEIVSEVANSDVGKKKK